MVIVVLERYEFSDLKIISLMALSVIISKVWLVVNYDITYFEPDYSKTVPFPNQKFYMNLGIWMSQESYVMMTVALLISIVTVKLVLLNSAETKNISN